VDYEQLVTVLALVFSYPKYHDLTLRQLLQALYHAEALHLLKQGRPLYVASQLGKGMAKAITTEYSQLSDSEEEAILQALDEVLLVNKGKDSEDRIATFTALLIQKTLTGGN